MNLKEQLAIQQMYSNQVRASKTDAELKQDEIVKLQNKVRQQNHVINKTAAAKVGKL